MSLPEFIEHALLNGLPDPGTGLVIPQARVSVRRAKANGIGTITYRCHTCGESIVKHWEAIFVDLTPGREWASNLTPPTTTPATTTHHDWHMASQQGD